MGLLQRINKKAVMVLALFMLFALTPFFSGCEYQDFYEWHPKLKDISIEVSAFNNGVLDTNNEAGIVTINSSENTTYYETTMVLEEGTVTLLATPRLGYEFLGWYSDINLTQFVTLDLTYSFVASEDVSFYANFIVSETDDVYEVTFTTPANSEYAVFQIEEGSSIGIENMPTNPTRGGYVFAGWSTNSGSTSANFTGESIIYADITIYAAWTPNMYVITVYAYTNNMLDDIGGTVKASSNSLNADENDIYNYYTGMTGTVIAAAKSGYTFTGWYTEAMGGYLLSTNAIYNISISSNRILYARFSEGVSASYIITFMNDGSTVNTVINITSGSSIGASNMPNNPTLDGYIFEGWNTLGDGTGTVVNEDTVVTSSLTVYAVWTAVIE
ncbi:MAG: InlB B-repeat-containing protein [Spirochaetales bacterium]